MHVPAQIDGNAATYTRDTRENYSPRGSTRVIDSEIDLYAYESLEGLFDAHDTRGEASEEDIAQATRIVRCSPRSGDHCPICLETFGSYRSELKACGHHFHHECITRWATRHHNSCPMCRVDIACAPCT